MAGHAEGGIAPSHPAREARGGIGVVGVRDTHDMRTHIISGRIERTPRRQREVAACTPSRERHLPGISSQGRTRRGIVLCEVPQYALSQVRIRRHQVRCTMYLMAHSTRHSLCDPQAIHPGVMSVREIGCRVTRRIATIDLRIADAGVQMAVSACVAHTRGQKKFAT